MNGLSVDPDGTIWTAVTIDGLSDERMRIKIPNCAVSSSQADRPRMVLNRPRLLLTVHLSSYVHGLLSRRMNESTVDGWVGTSNGRHSVIGIHTVTVPVCSTQNHWEDSQPQLGYSFSTASTRSPSRYDSRQSSQSGISFSAPSLKITSTWVAPSPPHSSHCMETTYRTSVMSFWVSALPRSYCWHGID